MNDIEWTEFMQWCLPQMRLRWPGFRKVRRQVCKRLNRRIRELGLSGLFAYKGYLDNHPEEWEILDSLCRITISRFYRDRMVFDTLYSRILPSLAKSTSETGANEIRCWCAGCCSGEEAYTLQILWKSCVLPEIQQPLPLRIIATDTDHDVLERAQRGVYSESSIADLPKELIKTAFIRSGESCSIRETFKEDIEFRRQDIRKQMPEGTFHLILCRNLVLTYFEEALQLEILERIFEKLVSGGFFIAGTHESIPKGIHNVIQYDGIKGVYQKAT